MNSQFEISIPNESFALVPERTQDGERIARATAQRAADTAESNRQQLELGSNEGDR